MTRYDDGRRVERERERQWRGTSATTRLLAAAEQESLFRMCGRARSATANGAASVRGK